MTLHLSPASHNAPLQPPLRTPKPLAGLPSKRLHVGAPQPHRRKHELNPRTQRSAADGGEELVVQHVSCRPPWPAHTHGAGSRRVHMHGLLPACRALPGPARTVQQHPPAASAAARAARVPITGGGPQAAAATECCSTLASEVHERPIAHRPPTQAVQQPMRHHAEQRPCGLSRT